MREVIHHRSDVPGDVNHHVMLHAGANGSGGAPTDYVAYDERQVGGPFFQVSFVTDVQRGCTLEMLLAICADRLEGFQQGPSPCEDNELALHHLYKALAALKRRTSLRHSTGDKMISLEPRLSINQDRLQFGPNLNGSLSLEQMRQGSRWDVVASIVKPWRPGLTPAEWGTLRSIATTDAAVRGFDELKKALTQKATPRLSIVGDRLWFNGVMDGSILVRQVQTTWSAWQQIENAVKRWQPSLTDEELDVLQQLAITSASLRGLAELRSALHPPERPKQLETVRAMYARRKAT